MTAWPSGCVCDGSVSQINQVMHPPPPKPNVTHHLLARGRDLPVFPLGVHRRELLAEFAQVRLLLLMGTRECENRAGRGISPSVKWSITCLEVLLGHEPLEAQGDVLCWCLWKDGEKGLRERDGCAAVRNRTEAVVDGHELGRHLRWLGLISSVEYKNKTIVNHKRTV